MKYTRPDYYKDFVCIASQCPDTCCANWQIVIDQKSLNKFKQIKGPFGNRIHNSIDWDNGVFKQHERQCTFLNEEKLCDMYVETGSPEIMCQICKTYPRHREEFTSHCDIMLSMSCPEVARIILTSEAPASFTTMEKPSNASHKPCDHSMELYETLTVSRDVMFSIIQNRKLSIDVRMSLILALANDIQLRINSNRLEEIRDVLKNYQEKKRQTYLINKILKNKQEAADTVLPLRKASFQQLLHLYHLNPNWERNLEHVTAMLYNQTSKHYSRDRKAFKSYMAMKKEGHNFEIQCEQLLIYFLFHYYCGAAYDEQQFAKVKYAVVSTMLIQELLYALWIENDGIITDEDIIDIAYQFSREVEHLDDNYLKFEKALIYKKEFRLSNLLLHVMGE